MTLLRLPMAELQTPNPPQTLKARLTELIGRPERSGMLAALIVHYEKKLQPLVQLERDVQEVANLDIDETRDSTDMVTFWRRCIVYEYRRAGSNGLHYRLRSDFEDMEDFHNFRMEIQEELDEERAADDDDDDDYCGLGVRRHQPDDLYQ